MSVKTIDEIMTKVREIIGEDDSDGAIEFVEDISDTLESFSNVEDWKTKYEENDKKWREKYRDRFFTSKEVEEDDIEEPEEKEKKKFEDLFE
jgi:hypothetical protein